MFTIENVICYINCTAYQWRNMPFAAFFKYSWMPSFTYSSNI